MSQSHSQNISINNSELLWNTRLEPYMNKNTSIFFPEISVRDFRTKTGM
jgi:hypothetical protein